jgi:hypothetical protein
MPHADEAYRERWLICFVATYSTIGVLCGIGVAVSTFIATGNNQGCIVFSSALAFIQLLLILWMFHGLRSMYDFLGFHQTIKTEEASTEYERQGQQMARRGKTLRQLFEKIIHIFLLLQIVMLILAWFQK